MSTITPTVARVDNNPNTIIVTWANMANGDVGAAVSYPAHADKSAQLTGTLGAGGSATVQGSNDGTNFVALKDFSSTAIALTALGVTGVAENTRYVRPSVTAGDGTTALTVTMLLRKL